jgi:signal transduction histidine kinase
VQIAVRELMHMLQSAVQDAQVLERRNDSHRFEVAADINPEAMVQIDPNLFEMALREVIHNAVKYSDREGHIQLRVHSDRPQNVAISISNEDLPMRPEEIGLLFERGYRSSEAMRRTAEGAGIGLYLLKAVMDAQKGAVVIENQGRTTTVKLELPVLTSR